MKQDSPSILLPTYADNLAEFVADLRSRVFSSQSAAARHFGCHSTTISRYENEKTFPPLSYLIQLIQLVGTQLSTAPAQTSSIQHHLLKEINQAIQWCYPDHKPFSEWAQLVSFSEAETSEPDQVAPLPATAPAPPRHFVGREETIESIAGQIMRHEGEPILVVQGMGGIGKSAFVKQLAARLQPEFVDNIFWANVADHEGQASPILRTWARLCGQELPPRGEAATLAEVVRGMFAVRSRTTPMLVILDDLREAWISTGLIIKGAIPEGTSILITTRETRVAQSLGPARLIQLDPLPPEAAEHLLKRVSQNELEGEEAQRVAAWCGFVPLALNLAALVASQEGANWLLKALQEPDQRLDIFELDHPQTKEESVRVTFAISYRALGEKHPETARLFRLLGVFAAPVIPADLFAPIAYPRDSAEPRAVPRNQTDQQLRRLVRWGLTTRSRTPGVYHVHPLLQVYTRELLEQAGEAPSAYLQHQSVYLNFAHQHAHPTPTSIDALEEVLPELLLAARRAAKAQNLEQVKAFAKIVIQESELLNTRGYYQEAIALLQLALPQSEEADQDKETPWIRNKLAFFYIQKRLYEQAWRESKQAYQLARLHNILDQQADSLLYQGYLYLQEGENHQAYRVWQEELKLRYEIEDGVRIANCLNSLGAVQIILGEYAAAATYLAQAKELYEELNNQLHIARVLTNRGVCFLYLGKDEEAKAMITQALERAEVVNHQELLARNFLNKGVLLGYCGEYSAAHSCLETSLKMWEKMGNLSSLMSTHNALAEIALGIGNLIEAKRTLSIVQAYLSGQPDQRIQIDFLGVYGAYLYQQRAFSEAQKTFETMQSLAEKSGHLYLLAQSKLGLSQTLLAQGAAQAARQLAQDAWTICQDKQLQGVSPRASAYLAQAHLLLSQSTDALKWSRETLQRMENQGCIHGSKVEIYWIVAQIFNALGHVTEQGHAIQLARVSIQHFASQISESALRASFLALPLHQQVFA